MKPIKTPPEEINRRINEIQKQMISVDLEAVFIVQRTDLFYFSGTSQNAYLFIPAEGKPLLFVKKFLPRAEAESSLEQIIGIGSMKDIPGLIAENYGRLPMTMGFEFDVMPVNDFRFFKKLINVKEYKDASDLIRNVRMIKSEWEIKRIKETADVSAKTFEFIQKNIRPGFTEIEFAGMYETFARTLGHEARLRIRDYQTEGYNWHILSGASGGKVGLLDAPASGRGMSASFPVGGGRKKLKKNEPIMIDIGIVVNGYHVDETRMFAIETMPGKALDASKAAIEIHNSIIEKAAPGIVIGEVFQHSVEKAKSLGYKEQFLGPAGHKVNFVGHGIGLELVEYPVISGGRDLPLMQGMVFSIEPKLVFKNKFSAGIESVVVITGNGCRLLSRVPVKIFISKK